MAGQRLVAAMNNAFPLAEVQPADEHYQVLSEVVLPDEDDRHVLAAAVVAEATVLCTSNTKDFPNDAAQSVGVEVLTPDQLLSRPVTEFEEQMVAAHQLAVTSLKGATDETTVAALRRAGVPVTADLVAHLLGVS